MLYRVIPVMPQIMIALRLLWWPGCIDALHVDSPSFCRKATAGSGFRAYKLVLANNGSISTIT